MEVSAAILAIGSEIFIGSIVDTNSAYLAKKLSEMGVDVKVVRPLPDDFELLVDVFKEYLGKYNLVLTTGGLGPTFDDMTAEAVANAVGRSTVFNELAYSHIESSLLKRGVVLKESHRRQAFLPDGCILLPNDNGTAMGFVCEYNGSFSISMPGIPYEMKPMFENYAVGFIKSKFNLPDIFMEDIRFAGLPESDVDEIIREIGIPEDVECIINVSKGEIIVRLRSTQKDRLETFSNRLIEKLKNNYIGKGEDSIEAVLVRMLKDKGLTISFVESCTGGLLSKKITDVSGSSNVFIGSVVSYSNKVKEELLGVDRNILEKFGAVSAETAKEMAVKCKEIFKTDISASVTGIAGPGGGSKDKPVGLVYTCIIIGDKIMVKENKFVGDRDAIRERSYKTLFDNMLKELRSL
ncbi:MAG: CinA family nicotinamide mononucleotide deamidase-related protein [Calditerrivibrio sp.]|nr:CinA family nicotinamide mononucleotide deamidase-related protein [Calditerrivibrio sp.]